MKLKSICLLVASIWMNTLLAQTKKITLTVDHQPIKKVFDLLQSKSDYNIIYSDDVVPDSMLVSVQAHQLSLNEVMEQMLAGKNLTYTITGHMLVIRAKTSQAIPTVSNVAKAGLSGAVYSGGKPVSFVTVSLLSNSKVLAGCVSDEAGHFRLIYSFSNSAYTLKVSAIGYQPLSRDFIYPDTDFAKQISLNAEVRTLNTVNVVAQRPLISRKADRYIINVEGSFLENGFSGLEVLQKSPGIWVDNNGNIRIKGNQSVMVMINDVVQRMSADDLAEYLRALKSESISKIEVISNPPSEFEASGTGGIIHIQLKKARSDGMVTHLNAQYRQQGARPYISTGGLVDAKSGNLYVSGNVSLNSDESKYIGTYHILYPDNSVYDSYTDRYNHNERLQYRLSLSYDLSKNQSIGIQTIGNNGKLEQSFLTDVQSSTVNGFINSRWLRRPDQNNSTFNYNWKIDSLGSMLKVIGDYTYNYKTELNQFEGDYSDPSQNSIFRVNTPNNTNIYTFQADYTQVPDKRTEIKTGIKFAGTNRDNILIHEDEVNDNWLFNDAASNHFLYRENLYMAYATLQKSWSANSVKVGLRGEETSVTGNSITSAQQFNKSYFGLFPTAFFNHTFNAKENEAIHFSYSRRLERPAFKELNPYRLQIDNSIVVVGNPDLLPQYTNNFELGADLKNGYAVSIYYAGTSNTLSQFAQPIAGNVLEYQFRNFDNSSEYGLSLNAPVKITPWWTTNNGLFVYHSSYLLFNAQRNTQTSVYAKTVHTIMLKKLFDINFYGGYNSPSVTANIRHASYLYTFLGFSRKFLKDNKGRLTFNVEDILNTAKEQEYTNYNNTIIDFYQKRPTRTFSLQFSYTITSGKKFTNKKIDQSNNEERSRLGN